MSEAMFPSNGAPDAAPAPAAPVSGGTNKTLLALGGIGAALVVGAGAFFLLGSGSAEPGPVAVSVPVGSSAAPRPAASTAPTAKPVVRPAAASVTGRDPFKALFVAAPATDSGSTSPTGGSTGTTGAVPVPAPAAVPVVKTVTLSVSKVDPVAQTVTVSVDSKKYATAVNTTFGTYYTVYSVFNDSCVGILYGDQSVAVCTNKPVSVSP